MYNHHFGLERAPFKITPDPALFFTGAGRGEVLEALVYAVVSGEGIIKVVGEVGTGKTMLCRMLEVRLPDNVETVYLANPSLSPEDILHAIALEMGLDVEPGARRLQILRAIQQHLLDKHARNQHVVILVEEAQSMPSETLEEIRLLSNLETGQSKLLQIVLFGQPELDAKLDDPSIRQLRERITHSFHLEPFTDADVRAYVDFRLRQVGYRGRDVFRTNAYRAIARASEGLTRRINILADKSLLAAYAEDTHDVARRHVKIAIEDSRFRHRWRWYWPEATMALGATLLVVAGAAWLWVSPPPVARALLGAAGSGRRHDERRHREPGGRDDPAHRHGARHEGDRTAPGARGQAGPERAGDRGGGGDPHPGMAGKRDQPPAGRAPHALGHGCEPRAGVRHGDHRVALEPESDPHAGGQQPGDQRAGRREGRTGRPLANRIRGAQRRVGRAMAHRHGQA